MKFYNNNFKSNLQYLSEDIYTTDQQKKFKGKTSKLLNSIRGDEGEIDKMTSASTMYDGSYDFNSDDAGVDMSSFDDNRELDFLKSAKVVNRLYKYIYQILNHEDFIVDINNAYVDDVDDELVVMVTDTNSDSKMEITVPLKYIYSSK